MNRNRSTLPLVLAALVVVWCAAAPLPAAAQEGAPAARSAAKSAPQGVVDVNTASEHELVAVPGIGESLARRIVQFREKNGPYQRIDDLLKVQGIGEKSLQKLRPFLSAGKKS